ncbi:uncharacterized protein LOC131258314 [Magnolia sinica]|uniref:uncharacterized protein LOC131258314 n=1 Tax=Magnolia sinica TaxID=86752 RepID=UPI002658573D|nr:uncharacterized protein LOC131258314 [Magnolia sinica]
MGGLAGVTGPCCCRCHWRWSTNNNWARNTAKFSKINTSNIPSNRMKSMNPFLARPRASFNQQQSDYDFGNNNNSNNDDDNDSSRAFSSPDDLSYLWKLAAGSVGGAAVIKYGSVIFPEITTPNILQAILMIGIPVLVSVLLLIKESSIKTPN